MRVLNGTAEVIAAQGSDLGVGPYRAITQPEVNTFADVTGDHQWIHIDVKRARESSFGTTIVHGFFTLSLLPSLLHDVYEMSGFALGVNYGLNRVRFPAPLPVGSRVRARATLSKVDPIPGGLQVVIGCTVELEGGTKPVCVADLVLRLYVDEAGGR